MSELSIELHWHRSEPELRSGKFSNAHTVRYNEDLGATQLIVQPSGRRKLAIQFDLRLRNKPDRHWMTT